MNGLPHITTDTFQFELKGIFECTHKVSERERKRERESKREREREKERESKRERETYLYSVLHVGNATNKTEEMCTQSISNT